MKRILVIIALFILLVAGSAVVSAAGGPPVQVADKQVYCNQEGNSGKWKAQIANGAPNEHEYKLVGVFVHDQGDDTAAMTAACQPKACPAGTTLLDYKDGNYQDPICKDDPTGCPYGDSIPVDSPKCAPPTSTTADDPNKGEVKTTTPTPVEDTVYPEFQGK